jgi:hypothetical protein
MKSFAFAAIVGFTSLAIIGSLHCASRAHGSDGILGYGLGCFEFGGYGGYYGNGGHDSVPHAHQTLLARLRAAPSPRLQTAHCSNELSRACVARW